MQGYASRQLPFILRQQETSVGWGVVAGKLSQLLRKILEAQVYAERLLVLAEKFARLGDLRGRLRLHQCKSGDGPRYPISMPPLTFNT